MLFRPVHDTHDPDSAPPARFRLKAGAMYEESHSTARDKSTKTARKSAIGSLIGTSIEWYDYFLYGTAAAVVFGPLFFPGADPLVGLMASFGALAVGFLARPVGGIVAGHVGDRIGRKAMLVASLLIMGASTTLIGILPTYAQLGFWAPALLLLLRLIQGFGAGAEWGGAALMSVEHATAKKRGFYGSFTQIGVPVGMLLATGSFALARTVFNNETFLAWGWRVPFLASALLIGVGLVIRLKLEDPPKFQEMKEQNTLSSQPIVDMYRNEKRNMWLATGMRISQNAVYYLYTVFAVAYIGRSLGSENNTSLVAVMIASALGIVSTPVWGALSDRFGRRRLYIFGSVGSGLFVMPFFMLADTGNPVLIVVAMVLGINFFHDAMYGPQAAFFSELFSTGVRYSGASISYSLGSVFGGGFSPLIATALLALGGGNPWLIVVYFLFLSCITFVCAYLAPETNQRDIDDDQDPAITRPKDSTSSGTLTDTSA